MDNSTDTAADPVPDAVVAALGSVLGVTDIDPAATFAQLGGDSLRALRVLSRLWRELGVELPVESLRAETTVTELVAATAARSDPA